MNTVPSYCGVSQEYYSLLLGQCNVGSHHVMCVNFISFHFISFHVIHSFTHLLGRSSPLDHVIFLKEKKMNKTTFYPDYCHSNEKKKKEEAEEEETWSRKQRPIANFLNPQPRLPSK